jgi:hypothetical protein
MRSECAAWIQEVSATFPVDGLSTAEHRRKISNCCAAAVRALDSADRGGSGETSQHHRAGGEAQCHGPRRCLWAFFRGADDQWAPAPLPAECSVRSESLRARRSTAEASLEPRTDCRSTAPIRPARHEPRDDLLVDLARQGVRRSPLDLPAWRHEAAPQALRPERQSRASRR